MKEIVIAGGGLAGLALGIALLRNGIPARIREAGSYPRHRVCGEFINGVTHATLVNLGIDHLFHDALRHESTRWWMGEKRILEARLSRPALGLSRWEMDERLQGYFKYLGGVLSTHDRAEQIAEEGFVWATGRQVDKGSDLLGLKAHFEGVALEGFLEMHLGKGGYLGLTPISADGSRINVCGLFKNVNRAKGENPILEALRGCGLDSLAERLSKGRMDRKSLTGISGIELGSQRAVSNLCTLGDAERMIPPFTGNGMSMAFESAECSLDPLREYAKGNLGWESARSEISKALEKRFRSRMRLAIWLHRGLLHPAGRATLSAVARTGLLPFGWLHRRLT